MKDPTPQQSRWLSYISEFSCTIHHIAGAENIVADALARSVSAINVDFNEILAAKQANDPELKELFKKAKFTLVKTHVSGHISYL